MERRLKKFELKLHEPLAKISFIPMTPYPAYWDTDVLDAAEYKDPHDVKSRIAHQKKITKVMKEERAKNGFGTKEDHGKEVGRGEAVQGKASKGSSKKPAKKKGK